MTRPLQEIEVPPKAANVVEPAHLAKLARDAGLIGQRAQLPPNLREFAALVATHCAAVVNGYEKEGGDAGEALIAYFELG